MPHLPAPDYLHIIKTIARKKKTAIHLVGGLLRDYVLGRPCMDYDFAVSSGAVSVARIFAKQIRGTFVLLDQEHGCARVVKKKAGRMITFDFADFRASTLKRDLVHRDLTINTLSIDLSKWDQNTPLDHLIVDFNKGLADIKAKCIRMTSSKVFQEDPLRLMRVYSLKAILGFRVEAQTQKQVKRDAPLLRDVSSERIREELFKILSTNNAASILKQMDKVGLLRVIMPQIQVMYGVKQGTYHHLDVWPHSLETVVQTENILGEMFSGKNPLHLDEDIISFCRETLAGGRPRYALMKLACLLHDIGKPDTKKIEQGRMSFHAHERKGALIVRHIARFFKLSTRERHALEDMIFWHLRPGYLSNFKVPGRRAIFRFFRDAKEEAVSILLLSLADQRSTRGPLTTEKDQTHHENICCDLINQYFKKKREKPFVRLINGHDIKKKFKLKPSSFYAEILNKVEEAQVLGQVKTKKEALALAQKVIKKSGGRK